jgi:hypothetical protein
MSQLATYFEQHLRRKFPLKGKYQVEYEYHEEERIHIEHRDLDVWGFVSIVENNVKIQVATKRPFHNYLRTVAHEYKHVLQRQAGKWKGKGLSNPTGPLETEANNFALIEVQKYLELIHVK